MEKQYLVPMTVNHDLIPTDSSLETELQWTADSGIVFEPPVDTTDGYQIDIPNNLLSEKIGARLFLEVSNDPYYPRVSIVLRRDNTLEEELIRIESASNEVQAVVYPKLNDEDPIIIPMEKEGDLS